MKNIYNGGLELSILNVIEKDRPLTKEEAEKKHFLSSLPENRTEFNIGQTTYYYDRKNRVLYQKLEKSMKLEQVPGNPVVIQRSVKNASGGWIHLDIAGNQEWDLYCERKKDFLFINGAPY
jgi:hypothetical protein